MRVGAQVVQNRSERPMKCATCSRPLHCKECGVGQ